MCGEFDKWVPLEYYNPRCEPKWRNWQTRYVQGVVGATSWEFKSPLRHQKLHHTANAVKMGNSLTVERLTLDQVVGVRVPVPQPLKYTIKKRSAHAAGRFLLP